MSLIENTHKAPLTRKLFQGLYRLSRSPEEYRTWLQRRTRPLEYLFGLEKDFWLILSGGLRHRLRKLDELKVARRIHQEASIRGLTLVEQFCSRATLTTLRLGDIRMAHPLLLDEVKSQRIKFEERVAALQEWKSRGETVLHTDELERLIPSSDPIVVTVDPLHQAPYVSATGNGRLAALKMTLGDEYYIECIVYR